MNNGLLGLIITDRKFKILFLNVKIFNQESN